MNRLLDKLDMIAWAGEYRPKGPFHYTRWIAIYGAGLTVAGGLLMLTHGETRATAHAFSTGAGVLIFGSVFGAVIDGIRAICRKVRAR